MTTKIKIILFASLIGAGIIGSIGFWYWRLTFSSKEAVAVTLSGPETAVVGQEITYTVNYKNNGNFVLENVKVLFELPENSLTEDDILRSEKIVGVLKPGEGGTVTFIGRLLGKEGDMKEASAHLFYTPKDLSVRYEGDASVTTKISSVPLTVTYHLPKTAESGGELDYSITYASNVDYPLGNMSLRVETVPNFAITSADPSSLDNKEWKLPTLNKKDTGEIKIKGIVSIDSDNSLNFSVKLGMWRYGTFIVLKETRQTIEVTQPVNPNPPPPASPSQT